MSDPTQMIPEAGGPPPGTPPPEPPTGGPGGPGGPDDPVGPGGPDDPGGPGGPEEPEDGGMDRRLVAILSLLGAIIVLLIILLLVVANDDGDDDDGPETTTTTTDGTSTSEPTTTTTATTTTSEPTTTTTEPTTTTTTSTTTTTTTTTAPPPTISPARCQGNDADEDPDATAIVFYDAWTIGDRECADAVATESAADTLFGANGSNADWTFEGCADNGEGEVLVECAFRYEGGASFFEMQVDDDRWRVESVRFVAD